MAEIRPKRFQLSFMNGFRFCQQIESLQMEPIDVIEPIGIKTER